MIGYNMDEFIWAQKYRPKTIDECILPQEIKNTFNNFIKIGDLPTLLLNGASGTGKTSVAIAAVEQLNGNYTIINGSMNGGIDTLRNDIQEFASTLSFSGKRKYVILDEADYLPQSTQHALRNFMEQFSSNCGFIMTCNHKDRIIEALHSRSAVIDFKFKKTDIKPLSIEFLKRLEYILKQENVEYDRKVLAELITKNFPDFRKIIGLVQRYSPSGNIDIGVLASFSDTSFKELVNLVKNKKFTEARKWIGENSDISSSDIFKKFYDTAYEYIDPQSIPILILLINKYDFQSNHSINQEINTCAFLVEVMTDVEFK